MLDAAASDAFFAAMFPGPRTR